MTPSACADTASALTEALFDGRYATYHRPWREAYVPELFCRPPHVHHEARARHGYELLRHVADYAGGTRDLLDDPHKLFALFEWVAQVAPDALPAMSVHNLALGAVVKLSQGREELAQYIDELDDTSSVGGFLLTRIGIRQQRLRHGDRGGL